MKKENGQSAVEFALVLPILLLIVCGILDFGWLFYNQLSVENACREGARVGCVNSRCTADTDSNNKVEAILPDNLDPVKVDVKLTNPTSPGLKDTTGKRKSE